MKKYEFINRMGLLSLTVLLLITTPTIATANNELKARANKVPISLNFIVDDDPNSVVRATGVKLKELVATEIPESVLSVNIESLGDRDLFEEMRVGNAQIIAPKISRLKRYSKRLQVFELPFIFYSEKAAKNFLDGLWGQRLLQALNNLGVNAHGYIHQGMKHITSDFPIEIPDDATEKAMGIFFSNTSKQYFESVGSDIVSLNDTEENAAMSNNLVNMTENNWARIYHKKIYAQHRYVLESNHTYTGNVLITNQDIWDSLPKKYVAELKKAIQAAIEHGNQYADSKNRFYRSVVAGSDNTSVSELAARDRYLWIEAANKIWSRYEDDIGSQLIDAAASHR